MTAFTLQLVVLVLPVTILLPSTTSADHGRLFPHHDEYDSKILDPGTLYGSPFGGFSRATASRLAALPLRLPDLALADDDDASSTTGHSFETGDAFGRGYICRVYHEDALEESSVLEGMLDAPVLRDRSASPPEDLVLMEEGVEEDESTMVDETDDELEQQHSNDLLLMETSRRLSKLEGICTQIHMGWWSYEWCYDKTITQFHIHLQGGRTGLEVRDVTSLGQFAKRKYIVDLSPDNPHLHPVVNKYADDEPELTRVEDTYTEGDVCEATGERRQTSIQYFCCSDRLMEKYKGPVLRYGSPLVSKIVSIVSLAEDPKELCTYTITICTPLLCEDVKGEEEDGLLFDISSGSLLPPSVRSSKDTATANRKIARDNETIRQILDRVIGKACIQSSTSSWWSYEYCHRKHVRQFHESITIVVDTGVRSTGSEDIYMLGYFNPDLDAYPDDQELQHVVNTTLLPNGGGGSVDAAGGGGSTRTVAAYFTAEYTGGDACDDPDVTDSAIKAGGVRSHIIERASSVRYSCGPLFDIYVKEDHTCHYIVEVTVPALCLHPLFKAPTAKKRVVKCLPVDDVSEWEGDTVNAVVEEG